MQITSILNGPKDIQKINNSTKATEGEVTRVKVLEYLGDGKLVIELKGQRVVADSRLMLEANQELDVIVKNADNNKIVLQILPEVKSDNQVDNYQHVCFSIPMLFDDEKVISLIELYHPKDPKEKNNDCGVLIRMDLQKLGFMEFAINISDEDLNCQIKTVAHETYLLTREHVNDLKEELAKLGYKVESINCVMQNPMDMKHKKNLVDTSV